MESRIDQGKLDLIWSYILEYENLANPYEFRQIVIEKWKHKAKVQIGENKHIVKLAKELTKYTLKAKDALHLACAIEAESEYFITTDDKILNKNSKINGIEIVSPIDMLNILEV